MPGSLHFLGTSRFRPPVLQPGSMARPRIVARLTSVVDSHPTALIVAPSGYGKTSAVAEWAAQHSGPLLWVTLGRFDANAARIDGMIAQALRSLAELHRGTPLELLRHLDPNCSDPATAFDTASQALAELDEPVRLVIDNAHIAREALTLGLLGALMDAELPQLRVVVVGTSYAELALSRLAVTRPQAVVRAYDLAFNTDEIAEFLRQQGCALDPRRRLQRLPRLAHRRQPDRRHRR